MEQKNVIFNGIYAIYDKVAESFSAPIAAPNDRTAWRIFLGVNDKFVAKSDLSLYRLGSMCITASPDDDNVVQLEVRPVLVDFSDDKDEVNIPCPSRPHTTVIKEEVERAIASVKQKELV